jgi:hypothetical protein
MCRRTGRPRLCRRAGGPRVWSTEIAENLPHQRELFTDVGHLLCGDLHPSPRIGTHSGGVGRGRLGEDPRLLLGGRLQRAGLIGHSG